MNICRNTPNRIMKDTSNTYLQLQVVFFSIPLKGLSLIKYDLFGHPRRVQFYNGNVTEYVYAATGEKLRVKHTTAVEGLSVPLGQTLELTDAQTMDVDSLDYWGRFQISTRDYRPIGFGVGKHVVCQFSGGYLDVEASIERRYGILGMVYVPSFHYYVTDYQGNVRLVVDGNGNVEQRNDYYAYGGPWGDNASTQGFQPFKYNGKELDRMHGLDWYDYGARMYDPAMGLFTQLDPLAEQYPHLNPYMYCAGNPVKYVDPDGKSIWTKLIKGSLKVGKQVAKTGVKALGETATYATAVADLVDDINVLTDSEAPTDNRIWAGVSLASEFLPISINDAKDVGKFIKIHVHGNSKFSQRAQHAYDIVDKETNHIVKTGISGGKKRFRDNKSQRAESQVRKWNKQEDTDKYESIITHEIPGGSGSRIEILEYEKEHAEELRRLGHLRDIGKHQRP